jgi:erythromycin esterase
MKLFFYITALLSFQFSYSQDKLILNLNKTIVPINGIEMNSNNKDIQKIWREFENSNVIGLGEGSHGTSDFFTIKAKMIKYGVEKKNVKLILIEESLGNTFPLNEYIQRGKGNAVSSLEQFGAWIYKVKEVAELIEFLKTYNETKPESEKVRFLGFDVQSISGVLAKIDQENKSNNESLKKLTSELLALDKDYKLYDFWNDTIISKVNELLDMFEKNGTNSDEHKLLKLNIELSKKLWTSNNWDNFGNLRDSLMYQVVIQTRNILNDNKTVLWGHNGHIMKYEINDSTLKYKTLGARIYANPNINYLAVGFDFNKGSFKAFNTVTRELTDYTVNDAKNGSTASTFKNLKYKNFYLSLGNAMKNPTIKTYLLSTPFYRQVQAAYDPAKEAEMSYTGNVDEKIKLWKFYDGWIFVNQTSASHSQSEKK